MIKPQRKKGQREADRLQLSKLYSEGKSVSEISGITGLRPEAVRRDLEALRREWRKSTVAAFKKGQAVELARIDQLERDAWEAWNRSKGTQVTTRVKLSPEMVRTILEERRADSSGNPVYLRVILRCINTRCRIFGLYAQTPKK